MFKFPKVNQPHIFLFGTGGTGGFALEYLTRLFANYEKPVTIEIYDGDVVETKNLKRQNFVVDDLDRPKVSALEKRLSKQVLQGPKFKTHTEYVTDSDSLLAEILLSIDDDETPIMVSAVDNIATRRLLNEVFNGLAESFPVIGLDSGNDDQGGQVVAYANVPVVDEDLFKNQHVVQLPNMLQLYPEIDEIKDERDENPGLVSYCAEEAESKPQAMLANVRNGEVLAGLIYQLSTNQPLAHNVWTSSILNLATKGETKGVMEFNE